MAKSSFASFRRQHLTFEIRYPNAYLLWDRSGAIWNAAERIFRSIDAQKASPNNTTFHADNRYNLSVQIDKAYIIDNRAQSITDQISEFICLVIDTLDIKSIERIGVRIQYAVDCKGKQEAASILAGFGLAPVPTNKVFDVEPMIVLPGYKVEGTDDQLGYLFQLYHRHRKIEIGAGPEVADLDIQGVNRETDQVLADIDLFTLIPTSSSAFRASDWLQKCIRLADRDIPSLLP